MGRTQRSRPNLAAAATITIACLGAVILVFAPSFRTGPDDSSELPEAPEISEVDRAPDTDENAPSGPKVAEHDTGPLRPRTDAGLVILPDGRVSVWGGDLEGPINHGRPEDPIAYSDGAVYTPVTTSWQMMSPTDLLQGEPWGWTVGVLMGDEVLWIRDGKKAAAWNYSTDSWRAAANPPANADKFFWNGEVVVASGANAFYDPTLDTWQTFSPPFTDHRDSVWENERLFTLHSSGRVTSTSLDGELVELIEASESPMLPGIEGGYGQLQTLGWHDNNLVVAQGVTWDIWLIEPKSGSAETLPQAPFKEFKDWPFVAPGTSDLTLIASGGQTAIYSNGGWNLTSDHGEYGPSFGSTMWHYGLIYPVPDGQSEPSFTSSQFN